MIILFAPPEIVGSGGQVEPAKPAEPVVASDSGGDLVVSGAGAENGNGKDGAAGSTAGADTVPRPSRRKVMRQYDLVELVKSYDPNADENLLNRAYVFAMKAHGTQLRASGDPYFHHPVEVAGILAGYKLDSASIATGLLHDTVEDTGVTLDEIRSLFGDTVARLVDGVTKLNKIHLQSAQTAQAENFRKLLLAMSEDIRVLLVKLADRLHNMRTLHFIKNRTSAAGSRPKPRKSTHRSPPASAWTSSRRSSRISPSASSGRTPMKASSIASCSSVATMSS
ncbi:MAG: HD domain-containing protein [Geminicoccaceae bacterium]